jgi:hypothetical protein
LDEKEALERSIEEEAQAIAPPLWKLPKEESERTGEEVLEQEAVGIEEMARFASKMEEDTVSVELETERQAPVGALLSRQINPRTSTFAIERSTAPPEIPETNNESDEEKQGEMRQGI